LSERIAARSELKIGWSWAEQWAGVAEKQRSGREVAEWERSPLRGQWGLECGVGGRRADVGQFSHNWSDAIRCSPMR